MVKLKDAYLHGVVLLPLLLFGLFLLVKQFGFDPFTAFLLELDHDSLAGSRGHFEGLDGDLEKRM